MSVVFLLTSCLCRWSTEFLHHCFMLFYLVVFFCVSSFDYLVRSQNNVIWSSVEFPDNVLNQLSLIFSEDKRTLLTLSLGKFLDLTWSKNFTCWRNSWHYLAHKHQNEHCEYRTSWHILCRMRYYFAITIQIHSMSSSLHSVLDG